MMRPANLSLAALGWAAFLTAAPAAAQIELAPAGARPAPALQGQLQTADFKGGLGYYNGPDAYPVLVRTELLSVAVDPQLDRSAVEALLGSRPEVDRAALSAAPISERAWLRVPLLPDLTADQVLDVARDLELRPGVRFAQPFVERTGELLGLTDRLLVSFAKGVDVDMAQESLAAEGLVVAERLDYVPQGFIAQFAPGRGEGALEISSRLYETGLFEWALPEFVQERELRQTPNDTYYGYQWHLTATSTTAQFGIPANSHVNAEAAWDVTTGSSGVTVAIIDDGVELGHEDLSPSVVSGYDFLGNDSNPNPGSNDYHGTAVAGVACAKGNNGKGVAGISWNSKIMPVRLVGFGQTNSDEAAAISFAKNNGADIMNNSWGPPDGTGQFYPLPANVKSAIDDAVNNGRGGLGCVIFWAAGNGNESADLDGYASYANVISVAASTNQNVKASYSDFGTSVDLCAPSSGGVGLDVVTTDRTGSNGYYSLAYTPTFGGTSSSCPLAAGVAALVLSVDSSLTFGEVYDVLTSTADKIGSGYNAQGFSTVYGYGKVDAYAAVLEAQNGGGGDPGGGDPGGGGGTVTVVATDVPKAIPDNSGNGVFSTMVVSGVAGNVTDIDLSVNIDHTYKGDLAVYLQRPDGQYILVHDQTGGGVDDINTTYDTQTQPAQPLSNLFGGSANGSWRLWAFDLAAQDTGTILGWSLEIETDAGGGDPGGGSGSFPSGDTPLAIPDNNAGGVTSNLGVSGLSGSLTEVDVVVDISHTYKSDLRVTLIHPDGTQVILHNQTGGSGDNVKTTYDTLTVPAQSLSTLNGKGATGTWRLRVQDFADLDVGTLNSWTLQLTTN